MLSFVVACQSFDKGRSVSGDLARFKSTFVVRDCLVLEAMASFKGDLQAALQSILTRQSPPIEALRLFERPPPLPHAPQKNDRQVRGDEITVTDDSVVYFVNEQVEDQQSSVMTSGKLFASSEEGEVASVKFPDLFEELAMLQWAGVGFGRAEAYRLYLSIKKLAEKLPEDIVALRFWGRVSTLSKPYFVVEGSNPEEDPEDLRLQEGKDGVNKYAYWVSQTLEPDSWTQLPSVTILQIVTAFKVHRFLTGNLEALVPSFPPFPGVEKNFLRAQIARIGSATAISPNGCFKVEDPEADLPLVIPMEPEESMELPQLHPNQMLSADAWRHHELQLNRLGRVTALPEETDDDGEPINSEESKVPISPPLATPDGKSWTFQVAPVSSNLEGMSTVVAKSLDWPGAVVVARARKFVCAYIGSCIGAATAPIKPLLPSLVSSEPSAADILETDDPLTDPTPPKAAEVEEDKDEENEQDEDDG